MDILIIKEKEYLHFYYFSAMINSRLIVTKPPNIIVKTESVENFKKVACVLRNYLERDQYTFHHLTSTKFLQGPWKDSCSLLMYESEDGKLCKEDKTVIDLYVHKCDGRVIFYSINKHPTETDISILFKGNNYHQKLSFKK